MKSYGLGIQIKAIEWYSISCGTIHFHWEGVSNLWVWGWVPSFGSVHISEENGSKFWFCRSPVGWLFNESNREVLLLSVVMFIMLYKLLLTFDSKDQIMVLSAFEWKLLDRTFLCCSFLQGSKKPHPKQRVVWGRLLKHWCKNWPRFLSFISDRYASQKIRVSANQMPLY